VSARPLARHQSGEADAEIAVEVDVRGRWDALALSEARDERAMEAAVRIDGQPQERPR
jgi:hypothetical protein